MSDKPNQTTTSTQTAVAKLPSKQTRKQYAEQISKAWHKVVESIFETGRLLLAAKEDLDHGEWLPMVRDELPFGEDTAQQLMEIARHPVLSKTEHARLLPPHWTTLHALTKLTEPTLLAKIEDGSITPKLERQQVVEWQLPPKKGKGRSKGIGRSKSKGKTTTARTNYIRFLRELSETDRYNDLMDFRTAVGNLGISISISKPSTAAQKGASK